MMAFRQIVISCIVAILFSNITIASPLLTESSNGRYNEDSRLHPSLMNQLDYSSARYTTDSDRKVFPAREVEERLDNSWARNLQGSGREGVNDKAIEENIKLFITPVVQEISRSMTSKVLALLDQHLMEYATGTGNIVRFQSALESQAMESIFVLGLSEENSNDRRGLVEKISNSRIASAFGYQERSLNLATQGRLITSLVLKISLSANIETTADFNESNTVDIDRIVHNFLTSSDISSFMRLLRRTITIDHDVAIQPWADIQHVSVNNPPQYVNPYSFIDKSTNGSILKKEKEVQDSLKTAQEGPPWMGLIIGGISVVVAVGIGALIALFVIKPKKEKIQKEATGDDKHGGKKKLSTLKVPNMITSTPEVQVFSPISLDMDQQKNHDAPKRSFSKSPRAKPPRNKSFRGASANSPRRSIDVSPFREDEAIGRATTPSSFPTLEMTPTHHLPPKHHPPPLGVTPTRHTPRSHSSGRRRSRESQYKNAGNLTGPSPRFEDLMNSSFDRGSPATPDFVREKRRSNSSNRPPGLPPVRRSAEKHSHRNSRYVTEQPSGGSPYSETPKHFSSNISKQSDLVIFEDDTTLDPPRRESRDLYPTSTPDHHRSRSRSSSRRRSRDHGY
eukprot:scaffold8837_cov54-Attheya_sp.AAC.3